MNRYIDADRLKKHYEWWEGEAKAKEFKEIFDEIIDAQPTADVVERKDFDKITEAHEKIGYEKGYRDGYAQAMDEVVRCKDCAYKQYYFTNDMVKCGCGNGAHHEDFFCADGERREDGEVH